MLAIDDLKSCELAIDGRTVLNALCVRVAAEMGSRDGRIAPRTTPSEYSKSEAFSSMSKGAGVAIFGRLREKASCTRWSSRPLAGRLSLVRCRSEIPVRTKCSCASLRVRYAGPICTLSMASCPSPNFP